MKRTKKSIRIIKEELNSRIEIQERTLQSYTKEIFENIGQVLSLVKFQLSISQKKDVSGQTNPSDSGKLLGKVIADLRNLTKQLSPDEIIKKGFASAIQYELKRLEDAGLCEINFSEDGAISNLEEVTELVVFCVLQQLTYPVLSIYDPGKIMIAIRYWVTRTEIEIKREFKNKILLLSNEEITKLNQRLETIKGSIAYKDIDSGILKIIINF